MDSIKNVITSQQEVIEKYESEYRKQNLIINGVPEVELVAKDGTRLKDVVEKVNHLCEAISDDFDEDDIESCFRLGKVDKHRNRPIKVKFKSVDTRNTILYTQKQLRDNEELVSLFGRVYVHKDVSPLMQKEEKRLREVLKAERSKAPSNTNLRLRSGKLYKDNTVIDKINLENQLF